MSRRNRGAENAKRRGCRQSRARSQVDIVIDPALLVAHGLRRASLASGPFTMTVLQEATAATRSATVAELAGQEAWEALSAIHANVVERLEGIADRVSPAEWLWILRRSLHVFDGINDLASTGPYARSIAEALSGLSANGEGTPRLEGGVLMFEPSADAYMDAVRLIDGSAALYEIHSLARLTGKGASLRLSPGEVPEVVVDPELDRAVRQWDLRQIESGGDMLSRAGLYRGQRLPEISLEAAPTLLLLFGETSQRGPGSVRWAPTMIDLREIPVLADSRLPVGLRWPQEVVDLVLLLMSVQLSADFQKRFGEPLQPALRVGYRLVLRDAFISELEHAIAVVRTHRLGGLLPVGVHLGTAVELFDRLLAMRPEVWPPEPGALLRPVCNLLFVDLVGATRRLSLRLGRPIVTGSDANVWGKHFEAQIQEALLRTPWAPGPDLLALRGRTLRIGRNAITDVDAWGEKDGVVLAVSCKSAPFRREYDRGERQVVQRIGRAALEALAAWEARVREIKAAGRLGGFDFSSVELVGVVVYPFAPFVPLGAGTREVLPGLPAIVGAPELESWAVRRNA